MKKILFVLVFTTLGYLVQAQVEADFGLKGGLNIANLKIESTSNPDAKLALYVGALAHLNFSTNWAIQPEIVYSAQGARQTASGTEYKAKLNYVNVPVLLQYMTGSGFRVQTGPQFGILTSAKSKVGGSEVEVDESFHTFDFAWAFGGSYITESGFGVDVRYNLGLANIADDGGSSIKNRVWQIGMFYQFSVSRHR